MIHAEVPSKATLLYSVEIPSTGGNTLFASG
jgi:alpha-ketoglutarate-dependent taurine dioxygenase